MVITIVTSSSVLSFARDCNNLIFRRPTKRLRPNSLPQSAPGALSCHLRFSAQHRLFCCTEHDCVLFVNCKYNLIYRIILGYFCPAGIKRKALCYLFGKIVFVFKFLVRVPAGKLVSAFYRCRRFFYRGVSCGTLCEVSAAAVGVKGYRKPRVPLPEMLPCSCCPLRDILRSRCRSPLRLLPLLPCLIRSCFPSMPLKV